MLFNKSHLIRDLKSEDYNPDFIGFWSEKPEDDRVMGPWVFSNFYHAPFYADMADDTAHLFCCVEQYMMYWKAVNFNDTETADKILSLENAHAYQYKKLGRKVKNFDAKEWSAVSTVVVHFGLIGKFTQNPELGEYLLSTGDAIIVEDSPHDKIWGIGMQADHPDFTHPEKWPGNNKLGFLLMLVRDQLKGLKEADEAEEDES